MDRRAIVMLVLGAIAGCSCEDVVDPGSDGNVIVSDARVDSGADLGFSDSSPSDVAGPEDSGPDAADATDGEIADVDPDASEADADAEPADAGDQCTEVATANITSGQAVANFAMYVGQIVIVEGIAGPGATRCTAIACPPTNPCCNTCSAPVLLDASLPLLESTCIGFVPGCNGDDCGLICRPPVLGILAHFKGRLVDSNGPALELYEALP